MKPNLGRIIVVALAASIALNLAMLLASSSVDLGRPQLTPAGKLLDLLGRPGGVLGQWLFPGHDLVTVLATLVSSFVFYGILILGILFVFAYVRMLTKHTSSS
jgi:hypothetical protein